MWYINRPPHIDSGINVLIVSAVVVAMIGFAIITVWLIS